MKGLLTPPLPGGGRGRFLGPGNRFGGRGRFSGCGFGGRGWAEIMAVGLFPGNSEVGRCGPKLVISSMNNFQNKSLILFFLLV